MPCSSSGIAADALADSAPSIFGTRSRCQGSTTVVAHSGSSPTSERTLSRVADPSGRRRTS